MLQTNCSECYSAANFIRMSEDNEKVILELECSNCGKDSQIVLERGQAQLQMQDDVHLAHY